jgi:hypothetical protein
MRVFRLLFLFIVFTGLKISFGQKLDKCTHMCRLKDSLDFAYTSNYYSEKLFKINKGQFFLYDENNAYLPDGRYGNLSEEKVQYVDSLPPFKLDFKRSHFNFNKQDESRKEILEHTKIDFAIFLDKALAGDIKAFDKFLKVYYKLDGGYAEFYDELIWQVMNYVGDDYLYKYLNSNHNKSKNLIYRYVTTEIYANFPICNKLEYCSLYFSKSFNDIIYKIKLETFKQGTVADY